MREVEKAGRSVEEAVAAALAALGVDRDAVEVEVLSDEGVRGFLGLLRSREVRVRVFLKPSKGEFAAEFLRELGDIMELPLKVVAREEGDAIHVDMEGSDVALLIGRHGQTLDALQLLTNIAAGRGTEDRRQVVVDVEGYRRRRGEALERLALRLAAQAVRTRREVEMEPMSAQERRLVHLALQGDTRVSTESRGEEPERRVVILPLR